MRPKNFPNWNFDDFWSYGHHYAVIDDLYAEQGLEINSTSMIVKCKPTNKARQEVIETYQTKITKLLCGMPLSMRLEQLEDCPDALTVYEDSNRTDKDLSRYEKASMKTPYHRLIATGTRLTVAVFLLLFHGKETAHTVHRPLVLTAEEQDWECWRNEKKRILASWYVSRYVMDPKWKSFLVEVWNQLGLAQHKRLQTNFL